MGCSQAAEVLKLFLLSDPIRLDGNIYSFFQFLSVSFGLFRVVETVSGPPLG